MSWEESNKFSKSVDRNTGQWRKNEKIINKSKTLKSARDKVEGFGKTSMITTGVNDEQYKEGYDKIKWNTDKPKAKFKVRINGVLQNPDEEA